MKVLAPGGKGSPPFQPAARVAAARTAHSTPRLSVDASSLQRGLFEFARASGVPATSVDTVGFRVCGTSYVASASVIEGFPSIDVDIDPAQVDAKALARLVSAARKARARGWQVQLRVTSEVAILRRLLEVSLHGALLGPRERIWTNASARDCHTAWLPVSDAVDVALWRHADSELELCVRVRNRRPLSQPARRELVSAAREVARLTGAAQLHLQTSETWIFPARRTPAVLPLWNERDANLARAVSRVLGSSFAPGKFCLAQGEECVVFRDTGLPDTATWHAKFEQGPTGIRAAVSVRKPQEVSGLWNSLRRLATASLTVEVDANALMASFQRSQRRPYTVPRADGGRPVHVFGDLQGDPLLVVRSAVEAWDALGATPERQAALRDIFVMPHLGGIRHADLEVQTGGLGGFRNGTILVARGADYLETIAHEAAHNLDPDSVLAHAPGAPYGQGVLTRATLASSCYAEANFAREDRACRYEELVCDLARMRWNPLDAFYGPDERAPKYRYLLRTELDCDLPETAPSDGVLRAILQKRFPRITPRAPSARKRNLDAPWRSPTLARLAAEAKKPPANRTSRTTL
ncbi:MAG: hypothetical protein ACKVPX_14875 [Myxococcaceae bacterium]